jgi:hypothetical protein
VHNPLLCETQAAQGCARVFSPDLKFFVAKGRILREFQARPADAR